MYFSALNNGFISEPIWDDCVEVSFELHDRILAELGEGRLLSSDENGAPITVESQTPPVTPTV
ncbi:hypothetical protein D3C71_1919260 [compost metagenome]